MDYGHPDRADRLAAEYVSGVLRGPARRRLEALLPAHPALRAAVRTWQNRLMPLTLAVDPVEPSAAVWPKIEARLGWAPAAARAGTAVDAGGRGPPAGWWNRLALWRGATALAGIAALALGVALMAPPAARPPLVVVLNPAPGATGGPAGSVDAARGIAATAFVAGVSADGRAMVTRPVHEATAPAGRALELWSLQAGNAAPRSLGLIAADRPTVVGRDHVLDGTTGFAVSLEPAGGSPTGSPTGPVLYVGKLGT